MPWPLSQDYNEAIQTPDQCFADPELKQGEAVCNALGLPVPCSGNFADVYAVQNGTRKWAVKCFTRQIPGLQERYAQISMYLQKVNLPFMVEFNFLQQGIRVRGEWYPVLKMQWVEGFNLNAFVRDNLDKPQMLQNLCTIWAKLAQRLHEANLAHCDLQHGNVLLVPSKAGALGVRLVDYDGMCVPALELLKTIELGHANYQHPQRLKEGSYGIHIDRFPHLVIYTALRALSVGGKALWEKFDNGDNLLFVQQDFAAPTKSPLFAELLKLNDTEVKKLTSALIDAAQKPIDQVPLLDKLVAPPQTKPQTAVQTAVAVGVPIANAFADAAVGNPVTRHRAGRKGNRWLPLALAACCLLALAVTAVYLSGSTTSGPTVSGALALRAEGKTMAPSRTEPTKTKTPTAPLLTPTTRRKEVVPEPVAPGEKADPPAKISIDPIPDVTLAPGEEKTVTIAFDLGGAKAKQFLFHLTPGLGKVQHQYVNSSQKGTTLKLTAPADAEEVTQRVTFSIYLDEAWTPSGSSSFLFTVKRPEKPTRVPEVAEASMKWDDFTFPAGSRVEDLVRLRSGWRLATKTPQTGPLDISAVARTEKFNIRLHAYNGACVIFNWELNPSELRVHRPDGKPGRLESGSVATAKVEPLEPNTWYTVRWRVTEEGCEVFVNGKSVFAEKRKYDLSANAPVDVSANFSTIEVRSLVVKPVAAEDKVPKVEPKIEPKLTEEEKLQLEADKRAKAEAARREEQAQAKLKVARKFDTDGRYDEAIAAYEQVIKLFPDTDAAAEAKDRVTAAVQARKEAEKKTVDKREEAAQAKLKLAKKAEAAGRYEEAIESYKRVIRDYKDTKTAAEAKKLLEEAKESAANARLQEAKALEKKGEAGAAKLRYEELIEKYPDTKAAEAAKEQLKKLK
jgi:TolA-binding protein